MDCFACPVLWYGTTTAVVNFCATQQQGQQNTAMSATVIEECREAVGLAAADQQPPSENNNNSRQRKDERRRERRERRNRRLRQRQTELANHMDAFMYEGGQPLPDLLSSHHQGVPPPPYTTLPPAYRPREEGGRRGWRAAFPGFYR